MTTSKERTHHDDDTALMQAQIRFLENETRALRETLRDRFAMAAVTGLIIAKNNGNTGSGWPIDAEKDAFLIADAMLEARKR